MYALLIGINQPSLDFRKLSEPANEVERLAELLGQQQYAVKLLKNEDATKLDIFHWLDLIVQKAKPRDRVLVYYTGHASRLDSLSRSLVPKLNSSLKTNPDNEFFLIPYQQQKLGISELISARELVEHLQALDSGEKEQRISTKAIHQRIVIIDACFGGYFINVSPLTTHMFENEMPPDGFYAVTSVQDTTFDGQYFPFIYDGLKGEADTWEKGNGDGIVGLFELTNYIDYHIRKNYAKPLGEDFYSRYIMVGSGEVALTLTK